MNSRLVLTGRVAGAGGWGRAGKENAALRLEKREFDKQKAFLQVFV